MIYIVADDLTGANDTGVQFAKKGYKTTVLILEDESLNKGYQEDCEVLVIDTETRNLEEQTARYRLNKILRGVNISKDDTIYKKIDSTMRGNVGAEIEEIMKIFEKQICIVSPSFPSHQRVTIGGYLLVQRKPLELSGYIDSLSDKPEEGSFIPSLLAKQTSLSIGRIDLGEVCKGQQTILERLNAVVRERKRIIVVDSDKEEHLQNIVLSGLKCGESVLFSGSAGLANYLAEDEGHKKKKYFNLDLKDNQGPILLVAGSRNPVMVDQVNFIKNNLEFTELKIDIKQICEEKNRILNDYTDKCLRILKSNKDLVIYTDAIKNEKESVNRELMQKYGLSFKELENKIKEFFGILTADIVKESSVRNLILTGGDIAISVCKELGISKLNILDELLPGIPLARVRFKNRDLNIVTKAGGFGKKDTLYKLINKFRNYSRL
jgi:uncharacterized protein YgbK (DUF1537 family)